MIKMIASAHVEGVRFGKTVRFGYLTMSLRDGPTTRDVKCVKVTRPATYGEKYGCYYPLSGFSATDEFDGAEDGEEVVLTLVTLTAEEFEKLEEFSGW